MKLRIIGWNYEGAHFRGFESASDETLFNVEVEGTEQQICDFVLENLSYGNYDDDPSYISSVDKLIEGYVNWDISNGDGCGGVMFFERDGIEVFINEVHSFEDEAIVLDPINLSKGDIDLNDVIAKRIG